MAWRTTVVLQRGVNSNESINRDLRKAHLAFRELQFREREQTSTYHHALDRVASTIREYWPKNVTGPASVALRKHTSCKDLLVRAEMFTDIA
jgi:hypothetical protein